MTTKYYKIAVGQDDGNPLRDVSSNRNPAATLHLQQSWYLHRISLPDGKVLDDEVFDSCAHFPYSRVLVRVQYDGVPQSFTLVSLRIPIVTRKLAEQLKEVGKEDIELVPAKIAKHDGEYALVNVLRCDDCLDEQRSRFQKWTKLDHRADLAGTYRSITKMVIDKGKGHLGDMFRIAGWPQAIIVSSKVKSIIESSGARGIKFIDVSE